MEKLYEVAFRQDVVAAAFASTKTRAAAEPARVGRCGRCAASPVPVEAVTKMVSRTFTGYDCWKAPAEGGLCTSCAWAYQHPDLRRRMHVVTTRPAMRAVTTADLERILSRPLEPDTAVVVPLRPGRKHILPHARWGGIAVEDTCLPWTARDVAAAAAMRRLRALGFGARMLAEPAAPYPVLAQVAPRRWPAVLTDWDRLAPYRQIGQWWELALRATLSASAKAAT
ncbi:hypothetical protein [Rhodococcus jostii]|uniref:hypothetical protein n=1 Tax=Rhodococcus jostii TaxID=132919 RepID=UPI00364B4017